ncbi:MAG: type II toxin-antitoxin system PemK/MazF family toxin [Chloroflexota bacterium]
MIINQGDVYWIQGQEDVDESDLGVHRHPYVVLQEDVFNHSRLDTVIVCALTTNMKQANAYGNVLLDEGEANLPKQSVVVVSKVSAVKKAQLGDYIGSLSADRVAQILAGMRFLQTSFR